MYCSVMNPPLSTDLRTAKNLAAWSLEENFLASQKASRLPLGVKVSRGMRNVLTSAAP